MQRNPFAIDDVRAFWDGVADDYDRINRGMGWTHVERFRTMRSFLPPKRGDRPMRVLNVWSRTGNAVPWIRDAYPDAAILNLEASPRLIAHARARYAGETFEQTDLHDLPCETGSQDVVVSLETLEHVPDPLHFLLECNRALKVGGRLILSAPPAWAEGPLALYEMFFENHGEGPHRFPRVGEVLRALRGADFRIVEHRGTVLLPVGPNFLKRAADVFQRAVLRRIGGNRLGIRHFYVAEKARDVDPVWQKIREEIVRPGLSMHSGTEVGLSKGTLAYPEDGSALPQPTGRGPVPDVCYRASPEVDPSYPAMNRAVFGKDPRSALLGEYRRIGIAHATDEAVRRNGASGGILTAALLHLLETKKIVGAVVLGMDPVRPWRATPRIARTREDLLAAAQSKYALAPVNTILAELAHEEGPLAYVGLPHQVFAIRRLQQLKHPSVRSIAYVLGPFYGNELHESSIESFLRRYGHRKEELLSLSYRAGEWPGHMEARLRDGTVLRMPKFHANYLIPFHITRSSLLSHDLTNEFTDLSGGDAWAPVYEERGKGFSLLLTRTDKGDALIREMEAAGKIAVKDMAEEEAVRMQSHGLDFKKRGTFLRIDHLRRRGRRVPEYGLTPAPAPFSRRLFERALGLIFTLCALPPSRWIADRVPDRVMGPLFQWLRVRWKALTRNVKRSGLVREN